MKLTRILGSDPLRKDSQTRDSLGSPARFGYEWNHYHSITDIYEEQFRRWISVLGVDDFNGLYLVDAGCGTGRNSYWMKKWGAKRVLAFDVEEKSVLVAKRNLESLDDVSVERMSIYAATLPDLEKPDLIFSIGVIHHLSEPVEAIKHLATLVKPGGKIVIWVYGQEGNETLLLILQPLRKLTSKLPMRILNPLSGLLTIPVFIFLKIPIEKSEYFKLVSSFRFWHLKSIVLDQLLPRIANYWSREEVTKLLADSGLFEVQIKNINGMSWSAVGTTSKL